MARVAAEPRARPSSTLALSHPPRTLLEAPPHCPETLLAGRRYMVSGHVGRLFDRRGLVGARGLVVVWLLSSTSEGDAGRMGTPGE